MTIITIRVSNLGKCYPIYDTPRDRLKQFVVPKLCRAIPALKKLFHAHNSQLPTGQGVPTRHSPGAPHLLQKILGTPRRFIDNIETIAGKKRTAV